MIDNMFFIYVANANSLLDGLGAVFGRVVDDGGCHVYMVRTLVHIACPTTVAIAQRTTSWVSLGSIGPVSPAGEFIPCWCT